MVLEWREKESLPPDDECDDNDDDATAGGARVSPSRTRLPYPSDDPYAGLNQHQLTTSVPPLRWDHPGAEEEETDDDGDGRDDDYDPWLAEALRRSMADQEGGGLRLPPGAIQSTRSLAHDGDELTINGGFAGDVEGRRQLNAFMRQEDRTRQQWQRHSEERELVRARQTRGLRSPAADVLMLAPAASRNGYVRLSDGGGGGGDGRGGGGRSSACNIM